MLHLAHPRTLERFLSPFLLTSVYDIAAQVLSRKREGETKLGFAMTEAEGPNQRGQRGAESQAGGPRYVCSYN